MSFDFTKFFIALFSFLLTFFLTGCASGGSHDPNQPPQTTQDLADKANILVKAAQNAGLEADGFIDLSLNSAWTFGPAFTVQSPTKALVHVRANPAGAKQADVASQLDVLVQLLKDKEVRDKEAQSKTPAPAAAPASAPATAPVVVHPAPAAPVEPATQPVVEPTSKPVAEATSKPIVQ